MNATVNKASVIRTLVNQCNVSLAEACKAVGAHYSQGVRAIKSGDNAPKSVVARLLKSQSVPVATVASMLKMTYSHAYRA